MAKLWNDILIEHLKNKKEALAYFNAALEDTKDGSEESQKLLFIALSNIVKAQGGFSEFSEKNSRKFRKFDNYTIFDKLLI